ncbi:MAG: hypothetical protein HYU78_14090 [Rhodocyclales bacterium]|nr:hypothetical protein [Rhodocyclales bacterium]
MTPIVFDAQALRAWTDFSGDRNPVHFDPAAARQLLGTETVVAHGMLAMLPLKNAIAQAIPVKPSARHPADHWHWQALLRRPVLCDTAYTVHTSHRPADDMVTASLDSLAEGVRHITSRVVPATTAPLGRGHRPRFPLEAERVATQHQQFHSAFPGYAKRWIFYDALLFARYLEHHLLDLLAAMHIPIRQPREAMAGEIALLQIGHAVTASGTMLRAPDAAPAETLHYSLAQPCITGTGDTRYATIQTTLHDSRRPLLAQEITLMIQTRSPAPTIHPH